MAILPVAAETGSDMTVAQDGPDTRFTYDANGNVLTRTDAADNVTTYEYDASNQLTAIRYPDDTSVTYRYDSLMRRKQMTDSLGVTYYEYDIHGQLTSVTDPNGYTLQYDYDPRGLLTQLVYPDGSVTRYTWDGNQHLTTVEDATGMTRYEYDIAGRVVGRTLPNGVITRYQYDTANQLALIEHRGPGGDLLLGFAYEFDVVGNRTQMTRTEADGTPQVTRYVYDALYQLVQVSYPDGEMVSYEYDAAGNRTVMTSSTAGVTRYTYNNLGQLIQLDGPQGRGYFTYDTNGNLLERTDTSHHTIQYNWDFENRLIGVNDGSSIVSFGYDGDGRRLYKTTNGKVTKYVQHGNILPQVIYIITGANITKSLIGLSHISETGGENPLFYLEDGLGNIVGEIDQSGGALRTTQYDAFGMPASDMPLTSLIGFTGEQFDAETSFLYLRARYYAPEIGRFISIDPYPANVFVPKSINRYVYVTNNPTNLIDPYGLCYYPENCWPPVLPGDIIVYRNNNPIQWLVGVLTPGGNAGHAAIVLPGGRLLTSRPAIIDSGVTIEPLNSLVGKNYDVYRPGGSVNEKDLDQFALEAIIGNTKGYGLFDHNQTDEYHCAGVVCAASQASGNPLAVQSIPFFGPTPNSLANSRSLTWVGGTSQYDSFGDDIVSLDNDNLDEYFPMFPPGGGGGGAVVGGISLDRTAEVLVNLSDIIGATFDPTTGQIILIGREISSDLALHPLNVDDLVVAIRTIYSDQEPSMSIEPCVPEARDGCMKVFYNGRFVDPNQPEWGWLTYGEGGLIQTDPPVTWNTHFGWVLFESDRYLKIAGLGWDNMDPDGDLISTVPFVTNVPDYMSETERRAVMATNDSSYQAILNDDCWVKVGVAFQPSSRCRRTWFAPGQIIVQRSADGQTLTFDAVTIITHARIIRHDTTTGQMVDVEGDFPFLNGFVDHFNQHYLDFAAEKRELAELIQLAKIVGLVRWMYDNGIPVDLSWIDRYQGPIVDTPLTTQAVEAPSGSIISYGGVEFPQVNSYQSGDASIEALNELAISARPSRTDQTWQFEQNGEILTAVALNLAPAPIVGGFTMAVTDLRVPINNQLEATITRQYNSVDLAPGPFGSGWSMPIPSLTYRHVISPENTQTYYPQMDLTVGSDHKAFRCCTVDGLFFPTESPTIYKALGLTGEDPFRLIGLPADFTLATALPGHPIPLRDGENNPVSYTGFALQRQDGVVIAFDTFGRLKGIRDVSGRQVNYIYNDQLLAAISDGNGTGIQLDYNDQGQLVQVIGSDNRATTYTYNNGFLIRVEDSSGSSMQYTYDEVGRLSQSSDGDGRVLLVNNYDGLGRLVSNGVPGYVSQVEYNDRDNQVTYRDAVGRAITRQYDKLNHLVAVINALGNEIAFQYDENDHLISLTDANGNTTAYVYDERGLLTESRTPSGEVTHYLHHNESGQPEVIIDPTGAITFFDYDQYGRVARVRSGYKLSGDVSSDENVGYEEGENVRVVSYEYDTAGNVTSIQDAAGYTTHYTYDDQGNVTSLQTPNGGTISQSFDEPDNLRAVADDSGYRMEFSYDPAGRLTTVRTPAGETEYTYEAGLLTTIEDPLENTTRYGYDAAGRLVDVIEPGGANTRYEYDPAGYLTGVIDPLGVQMVYNYDDAGRLISVQQVGSNTLLPPSSQPSLEDINGDAEDTGEVPQTTPTTSIASPDERTNWWLIAAIGIPGLFVIFLVLQQRKRQSRSVENQNYPDDSPAEPHEGRRKSRKADGWENYSEDFAASPRRRKRRRSTDQENDWTG